MKSIRFIITIITIILFVGLPLSGCDNKSQTDNRTQIFNAAKQVGKNKDEKYSLENLNVRIETISKESKEAIGDISKMKAQLQEKKLWLWGSIGLSIVAFILCLVCLKLCKNLQGRVSRHRKEIENLKPQEGQDNKANSKNSILSDYDSLKRRLESLETKVSQLSSSACSPQQPSTNTTTPVAEVKPSKKAYFGNPVPAPAPYFKKLLGSGDPDARFSVEISGNEAIFMPIDSPTHLGTLVSNDAMRAAVEFTGCFPAEALSMQVESPGKAEQKDNRWFITDKAQIHLSK